MSLLASFFDQSKYLRAEDLTQEKLLRIKSVSVETVGRGSNQEQKPVLWFTNHVKGLVLNKTNNRTIHGAYGAMVCASGVQPRATSCTANSSWRPGRWSYFGAPASPSR
jgi:hypothetical protein